MTDQDLVSLLGNIVDMSLASTLIKIESFHMQYYNIITYNPEYQYGLHQWFGLLW